VQQIYLRWGDVDPFHEGQGCKAGSLEEIARTYPPPHRRSGVAYIQKKEIGMKFFITMNMPSRNGGVVHQIIGDHESESLEEFMDALNDSDFVLVEEFYMKPDGNLFSVGNIVLNTMHVGKVKVSMK
jgi:hypothetical protein